MPQAFPYQLMSHEFGTIAIINVITIYQSVNIISPLQLLHLKTSEIRSIKQWFKEQSLLYTFHAEIHVVELFIYTN